MFAAKGIDPNQTEGESSMHDATAAGRGYACAGGVADAIENVYMNIIRMWMLRLNMQKVLLNVRRC